MKDAPRIVLRYFDARGRAQFMRYYFAARELAYADERVPLSDDFTEWRSIRDDVARTGPFKKLPVLHFGDETVVEALVICAFLHERLGDAKRLSATDNLRHAMLASSLYCDVMIPIGTLIWADLAYSGADVVAVAQATLARLRRHLEVLNATLERWGWLGRRAPETLAECLLWDQLMNASQVFGKHLGLGDFDALGRFFGDFPARAQCLKILETEPCPITARPGEAELLAAIRGGLDEAARSPA